MATLMLEILLTRITSVIAWYHLAFFVISLAMLGMTAGAIAVFVWRDRFTPEQVPDRLASSATWFALTTPLAASIAMSMPLLPVDSLMDFLGLLAYGGALAVPFALSGVTLTLALTRAGLPPDRAYGVDLVGAALGCALVIPLLGLLDAPSAVLVASGLAGAAAVCFARAAERPAWRPGLVAVVLVALGLLNAGMGTPLRPAWVKGEAEDPDLFLYTGWNTYSRVTVDAEAEAPPGMWAKSYKIPPELDQPIKQRRLRIDGAAATLMAHGGTDLRRHRYLLWDITSFAHLMRRKGPAAVIGVGGGRDVLAAAVVGHEPVVGIELNDQIVELHEGEMREFSGIATIPEVELVSDEARSYLARDDRRYSVITMSLIDTWASTGAGAYSLSENGLYTVEAFVGFMQRLTDDGIFTVSRWYLPRSPGETARLVVLGMDSLYAMGVEDPRQHIILLQWGQVATLLISPSPFSKKDLQKMQKLALQRGFNMVLYPGKKKIVVPILADLYGLDGRQAMLDWSRQQELDLTPPTDDRPFFFNMLKPSTWLEDPDSIDEMDLSFLGNLQATQTLVYATLVSLLLTLLVVVAPLVAVRASVKGVSAADVAAAGGYFGLIGLGFMFVEIGLLSRLGVFLGHPTLALAVLLGGLILFTGIGSLLSGRLDLGRPWVARLYPLAPAVLVVAAAFATTPVMASFSGAGTGVRVLVGAALVAVPALVLGLGFPLGLRLVERATEGTEAQLGPWLWAINGAFGVCASGLALGSSMVWGIPVTLGVGAACYLLLLPCTWRLARS